MTNSHTDLTMAPALISIAAPRKLRIAMFPWLAFGHMIPFLEVAKLIALKGNHVYFISTPRNIDRLPNPPSPLRSLITFVKLPFPADENLPENAEATSDIPLDKMPYLKKAHDQLQQHMSVFLESSSLDWIIYDFAPFWLPSMAAKLGIRRVFFCIFPAWSMCLFGSTTEAMINEYDPRKEPEHFTVTPKWVTFPTNLAFALHDAKFISSATKPNDSGVSDVYRLGSVIQGCDLLAIRSCMELEPEWLHLFADLHQKPVVPVGLLPPSVEEDPAEKDDSWDAVNEWMEKQEKESVVYVALGSEVTLSQAELTELALGLELSGVPFFWALRMTKKGSEQPLLRVPEGFEDRVKGRGMIWRRWAPQLRILSHESVGGFLSHCGWSSVIEGMVCGCGLVMLPFMVDQGLNARVMEERKVGVVVPREDDEEGLFRRDDVAECVRLVMADQGKSSSKRDEVRKMSKLFGDRELHYQKYMNDFIKHLSSNFDN